MRHSSDHFRCHLRFILSLPCGITVVSYATFRRGAIFWLQLPNVPIHFPSSHVKYHVSLDSLHRMTRSLPVRDVHECIEYGGSGQPIAATVRLSSVPFCPDRPANLENVFRGTFRVKSGTCRQKAGRLAGPTLRFF